MSSMQYQILDLSHNLIFCFRTLPAVRPAYEGPIDIVPVIKQEKFSDDEGEGPTPRNGARARKDSDSSKNDGPRARKTFPNNKSRNFTNPQNQNLPYQSPQCQSILNESNGMVLVPVQRATNATSTPKIMVVATRNLMGNANSAGSSRGAQAPGTSSSRIAEVPLTNGHGPSNNGE